MFEDNKKDKLESVEKNLYSRNPRTHTLSTSGGLKKENIEVVGDWAHEPEVEQKTYYSKNASSITKKIMIFSLLFFFVALAIGLFIYFRGANVFSSDNIEINILAPVGIAGGDKLSLEIEVKNNNNTTLEGANLKIEYPEGTRNADNIAEEKKREVVPLGDIPAGGNIKKNVSAILFGEENSKKEISASVEYRVKGSNAIYEKIKKFEIALTSAPITLNVSSLDEINSGQDIEFTVDVSSNSPNLLEDLMFKGDYPFGFTFKDATPKPSFDKNVWKIGDLKSGEKRTIKIRGTMVGQNEEERVFRFSAGLQSKRDEKVLEPIFLAVTHSVLIQKPFIGIDLALDGETLPLHVARIGSPVRGDVIWENNLTGSIDNLEIRLKITGDVDRSTIDPASGFYNSSENVVLWNSSTDSSLRHINPGEEGRSSFTFSSLLPEGGDFSAFKNPEVMLSVDVKGKRTEESNVPEEIKSTATAKVRFETALPLTSELFYYDGPFKNTGPIPPKAEKETTYTVTWSVGNTWNDVRDVAVTATLPTYVKWLNKISPSGEKITYNPAGGSITWNVGEIKAGKTLSGVSRTVSFQVSFLPSTSQVNNSPVIVNSSTITGVDRFTETSTEGSDGALNTEFGNDSGFKSGDGEVTR